ncbi:MAG TPA: cyclase family protein [Chloroflexota bacterium]|nr:cyclase family protein [Chloroflexota bacterium]
MRIIDISLPLSTDIPVWPGDPKLRLDRLKDLASGDGVTVSHLSMCVHTGTHIDAPAHFLEGGAYLRDLDLTPFIGPAQVVHIADVDAVTPEHLERLSLAASTERLLVRTRNSELWRAADKNFRSDFVAFTSEAAEWLAERRLQLVGIDYLSVQRFQDPAPTTHELLLGAGTVLLEGLNLMDVAPGRYQLCCLPLSIPEAEGAPARAVLISQ